VVVAALAVFLISGRGGSGSRDEQAEAAEPVGAAIGIDRGQIELGKPFPGFTVTDANGGVLATRGSLSGKPTIIWFTTSYCLPCQVGAEEVARLDDELGGEAFNVLVAFVDPSEPPSILESWRAEFGRPDWIVSLDPGTAFAQAVGVVALDTKLLLDPGGVLEDVNAYQVDDTYLDLLRRTVRGSK
jgi:thiol-disulfide isomerase/thioredoxin